MFLFHAKSVFECKREIQPDNDELPNRIIIGFFLPRFFRFKQRHVNFLTETLLIKGTVFLVEFYPYL